MTISDRLYGKMEITEPVILALLRTPSLTRLKGVSQHGYSEPYHPGADFSRFEHSLGVFLLLRKFGASLEEQLSGLIHDISHSAFSHCIDYVSKEGDGRKQNHQDNIFASYLRKSEIPAILKRYRFKLSRLQNEQNFPLKERPLPDLCADRLDYSLRLAVSDRVIPRREVRDILNSLKVIDSAWVFKDMATARKYARLFRHLNSQYYAGRSSAIMHYTVGSYLRRALEEGYIKSADFYTTDQQVLKKIARFHKQDAILKGLWARMNNMARGTNNPRNYEAKVDLKSRLVDPLFLDGLKIKRLSGSWPSWRKTLRRELKPKRYLLKFSS